MFRNEVSHLVSIVALFGTWRKVLPVPSRGRGSLWGAYTGAFKPCMMRQVVVELSPRHSDGNLWDQYLYDLC